MNETPSVEVNVEPPVVEVEVNTPPAEPPAPSTPAEAPVAEALHLEALRTELQQYREQHEEAHRLLNSRLELLESEAQAAASFRAQMEEAELESPAVVEVLPPPPATSPEDSRTPSEVTPARGELMRFLAG